MKKVSKRKNYTAHLIGAVAILGVAMSTGAYFVAKSVSADSIGNLLPIANGIYQDWTRLPINGTAFTAVDESNCNGNTDVVRTSTVGARSSFTVDLSSVPNGSLITSIAITPCASRNSSTANGSSVMQVFYNWNGQSNADAGNYNLTGTTPSNLPTTNYNLTYGYNKTASSVLNIGVLYSSGDRGARLSRLATSITYTTPPTAPTNLVATYATSSGITLTWRDNATNEDKYYLQRSIDGVTFYPYQELTTNTFVDRYLTRGTFYYRVFAYNAAGLSAYSNTVSTFASGSAANSVDLMMNPVLDDYGDAIRWSWCGAASCTRSVITKIQNIGTRNTISHLNIGEGLGGTNIQLAQVDRVDAEGYVITPNVPFSSINTYTPYSGSQPWLKVWKVAQQPINAGRSMYYRITYRFMDPPGASGYSGDDYRFEVQPASGDIEISTGNNNQLFTPLFQ